MLEQTALTVTMARLCGPSPVSNGVSFPPRKEASLPSYHTSVLTACSGERVVTVQDTKDESADGPEAISLVMKQSAFSSLSPTTGFVGA